MYANYFGLKEPSFTITPDPQYLFLSEQHREALAHLVYGAGENGGFVLLTGEVGTGKTTVCRAFLEQIPENVDVALILNPAMTVTELLRAVCDEFRIPLVDADRTVKRLVDRLNQYLLEAHANGRRPVLMIDESQNLRPKVLEQVRLLTNLETTKHKLLQIFLVGQPELRALLQRPGLRQLNQRITARYHLQPFNPSDTAEYVRHRLAVAGVDRPLFTRSALRRIHRLSGGVPRLINILCDRALLGASVTRSPMVSRQIVDKAAREVQDGESWGRPSDLPLRAAVAAALAVALVGAGWIAVERSGMNPLQMTAGLIAGWRASDEAPASPEIEDGAAEVAATDAGEDVASSPAQGQEEDAGSPEEGAEEPRAALAKVDSAGEEETALDAAALMLDQASAMRLLMMRWSVELGALESQTPCAKVDSFGLRCETDEGGWSRLRDFDRPALLKLRDGDGNQGFAALGALDAEYATVDLPEGSARISLARLDELWTGEYLMVWQPPPVGKHVIGPGSSGESVRWLRKLLSQVPGLDFTDSGSRRYNQSVRNAVRRFQTREGLEVDGIAGPRTLIRLHNAVAMPGPPRLQPES